jgi:predicted permease
MTWWNRLTNRAKLESQLDKELSFHIEEFTADLIARGHTPAEARRLARLELGGPAQVKEECRDARGTRWVEDFLQDVRYALRTLRQKPGFAAVALLSLALGTGATTAMFTVIDGVLLKPFAYRDPSRLVTLMEQTDWSTPLGNLWTFTYPNYLDCKRETYSLDMAAWTMHSGTVNAPGAAEYIAGLDMSADLFSVLGVNVGLGRMFLPEEDKPGAPPVAIISHNLWQQRFRGSPEAIGSRLIFDGQSYTVVGVMPAGFRLADDAYEVFTPIGQITSPRMENRAAHGFGVWARLKPGASLAQARTELAVVGGRLAGEYPKTNKGRTFIADPLKPDVGDTQQTLWLLLAAVGLVLLIACANIASLLLARAVSRERELAMRVALGAGRGRLARQCLTESAVLALAGGALGVLLAAVGIRPFALFWPGGLPRVQEVGLNWHVLLFAMGISLASGLLFGLAPALRASARHLSRTVSAGARTVGNGSHRLHAVFVAAEIAIAVVLLVSAGLLGRTMLRLSALNPGVDIRNVLTARTALAPATLADPERTRAAWQYLMDRVRRVPGVQAVAMVDTVPMRQGSNEINYALTAAPPSNDGKQPAVLANSVTPDYLKVTGIPLRQGRFLTDDDRKGQQSVAVIDDVMAQQAFPGQDALGKHIWLGIGPDPVTVVGVVGHVRQYGLASDDQAAVRAQLYYPFAQVPDQLVRRWSELMSIAVRTGVDPLSVVEPLRHEVSGATGDQVLYEINTFEQLATASLARQRFLLLLFSIFAGLALLLACIGIYGVLAYLTSQRVPEIGVRMALGATAPSVMWMVLRQSLSMILAGIVLGAAGSWLATRSLVRLVEGVRSAEPSTFGAMIAVLVIAALIASFLPARRASRVDPIKALRQE